MPSRAELRVGAADDDRRALRAGLSRAAASAVTSPTTVPGATTGGKTIAVEAAELEDALRPVAAREVEHPRARAERGIGDELARELGQDPVAEHADVRDRVEDRPVRVAAIQRKRAGAVIETQSPARS